MNRKGGKKLAISRKYILTVDGYTTKLSSNLMFYKNDALNLIFSVNEYGVQVKNGVTTRTTMPIEPLSAFLIVETPENRDYIESTMVNGDEITFHLDERYTNFVGISRMQIVLIDEQCCQLTLPEFKFEVRENIYDGVIQQSESYLIDENDGNIVTEYDENILVGQSLGGSKEIKDLVEVGNITGTEDMILQNEDGMTRRVKTSTICSSVLEEISNPFAISMSSNIQVAEIGSTIQTLKLTWEYNRDIVSQKLDNATLNTDIREQNYANIKENKTFTMTSKSVMGVEKTVQYTVSFANGIYYGKSKNDDDSNVLFSALTKQLSNSKSRTISVNAGEGERIYYCYPKRLGNVTFTVNGFDGGFNLIKTFKFKNSSNYEEDYVIYKSTNANLGNTTITIK